MQNAVSEICSPTAEVGDRGGVTQQTMPTARKSAHTARKTAHGNLPSVASRPSSHFNSWIGTLVALAPAACSQADVARVPEQTVHQILRTRVPLTRLPSCVTHAT